MPELNPMPARDYFCLRRQLLGRFRLNDVQNREEIIKLLIEAIRHAEVGDGDHRVCFPGGDTLSAAECVTRWFLEDLLLTPQEWSFWHAVMEEWNRGARSGPPTSSSST